MTIAKHQSATCEETGTYNADVLTTSTRCAFEQPKTSSLRPAEFFRYFDGKTVGYAIKIGKVTKYRTPYCPTEQHGVKPPQPFLYLPAGV